MFIEFEPDHRGRAGVLRAPVRIGNRARHRREIEAAPTPSVPAFKQTEVSVAVLTRMVDAHWESADVSIDEGSLSRRAAFAWRRAWSRSNSSAAPA